MANTFKVYLYKKTKGSDDEYIGVTKEFAISIGTNKISCKLTLNSLKYKKKVYEPCEILVSINLVASSTLPTNAEVVNAFLNQLVDVKINTTDIATNYFVYKVRPIFCGTSSQSMTVELGIYSPDKLMTLDKYSRAYTAKRLYTDILLTEAANFHLNDDDTESNCTKLSSLVANHLQMLKYKYSSTNNNVTTNLTLTEELRIPYIVQYDESFYHFLVRAANRYGEFLFFENGKLNFGMKPSEANYYKLDSNGAQTTTAIDWGKETTVQRRYYESVLSEAVAVEHTAYSYKDHSDRHSQPYASDSSKRYNFDTEQANEWLNELENDKYKTQGAMWASESRHHIVSFVCRGLGYTNLADSVISFVMDMIKEAIYIAEETGDCNSIMKKANYDPIKNADQYDSDKFRQFTTYDGSDELNYTLNAIKGVKSTEKTDSDTDTETVRNYTNVFYPLLRKKEKEIGEQAVWLDFGENFKPIMLGDKLHVDEKDYVVISVEGSCESFEEQKLAKITSPDGKETYTMVNKTVVKESLLVSAVPVLELSECYSVSTAPAGVTTTDLDSWSTTLPLPPALPDVLITDARPQVAFVAQYTDPEALGRIRVRYPWQHKDDDASPWIRVTLPYATSGGSVNFTPSEGDEVMVGYEHGNIDHPYAMGYLVAPFVKSNWGDSLPFNHWGGKHGIKVKTGHHLTFDDGANLASLFAETFAPLSLIRTIFPARWFTWLGTENTQDCAGGFELSDRYGFYKIKGSTDERNISISSPMGTVNMNAFQGITISSPTGDVKITGKNVTISAANKLNITSGTTIKDRFYYQNRWNLSKSKAFGIALGMDLLDSAVTRAENFIDISLYRCVIEVILRPVDGTLKIKSYTFLQMEAGSGATEIPNDSFRFGIDKDKLTSQADLATTDTTLLKFVNSVRMVKSNSVALIKSIQTAYTNLVTAKDAFMEISGKTGINKNQGAVQFSDIITHACGQQGNTKLPDNTFHFDALGINLQDVGTATARARRQEKREVIIAKSEALRTAAYALSVEVKKWINLDANTLMKGDLNQNDIDGADIAAKIQNKDFYSESFTTNRANLASGAYNSDDILDIPKSIWKIERRALARYAAYEYIKAKKDTYNCEIGKTLDDAKDALDNDKWFDFIDSINKDNTSKLRLAWKAVKGYLKQTFKDEFYEYPRRWKNGFEGKILFSDTRGKTASFDSNQNLVTTRNQNIKEANISTLRSLLFKF